MRRNLTLSFIIGCVLLIQNNLTAQLNGVYTIGGTTPDYTTCTNAVTALVTSGVSGPVVFNIRDGSYSEQFSIPNIVGASMTNTITFQSENNDSSLVTITYASSTGSNYVLSLNGANYITFSAVTLKRTGTGSTAVVISVDNGTNNCVIKNCVISNDIVSGSNATQSLVYSAYGPTSVDNLNSFENNLFENGSYGLNWNGVAGNAEDGNVVMNNEFKNQVGSALQLSTNKNMLIKGNHITTNITGFGTGINMNLSGGGNSYISNKIDNLPQGLGIQIGQSSIPAATPDLIANNFISITGGAASQAVGINISTSTYVNVYHNSVNITAVVATLINNDCVRITGTSTNNNIKNNCLFNQNGYIFNMSAGQAVCNYNNVFRGSANNFAYWNGAAVATFAAWKTASSQDINSINLNPGYVSPSDLHITNYLLNSGALAGTGVTTDIDNEPRDPVFPDFGADEFTPPVNDLGVKKILKPFDLGCGDSSQVISVIIKNYAFDIQTGFDVHADVTGFVTSNQVFTYTDTLLPGGSDTVYFTNPINTFPGGTLTISAYTALSSDTDNSNDTITTTMTLNAGLLSPTPVNTAPVCINDSTVVEVTPAQGGQILWYANPNGTGFVGAANPLPVVAVANKTYYAKEVTGSITGCLRISKVELADLPYDFIEIQNVSGAPVDATGWVVAASNSYTDINLVNTSLWNLGNFLPGEIQFKTDNANTNYWGSNLLYNTGSKSWAAIVDNNGALVDILFWDYTAAEIATFNAVINGFTITVGSEWIGDGVASSGCTSQHIQRQGNTDNNVMADFGCGTTTAGTQSTALVTPFSNCGAGCASPLVPVTVSTFPQSVVSLGNDTTIAFPNTVTLNAGSFVTYLWSTGATTQTITVASSGTYVVTVTDANGCTASDAITVNVLTAMNELVGGFVQNIFPQPAKDLLTLTLGSIGAGGKLQIVNNMGQVVMTQTLESSMSNQKLTLNTSTFSDGWYSVTINDSSKIQNYKVMIQR